MIRLILRILGIRDFETCKSCDTLQKQLEYERANNQELINTLMNIMKPKVIEATPVELQPIVNTGGLFSRRRAALEERDRLAAQVLKNSNNVGRPDNTVNPQDKEIDKEIEKLEKELGVQEQKESNG